MDYDIFTPYQKFAEALFEACEEDYYLDSFVDEEMYCFRDLSMNTLSRMKCLLKCNQNLFEVRNSLNGDIVWPNPRGFDLDQVLDVL
jgi:hypothetical protein